MPEIGTSGLMSEDRKRSVATWPKPPRLSSTLLYDPKNRDEALAIMLRNGSMKEPDIAKTYDFFRRLGFFNRSDAVSRRHIENIMDVLVGFGDIEKRFDVQRLIVPDVTKLVD